MNSQPISDSEQKIFAEIIKSATGLQATGFERIVGRGMSNDVLVVATPQKRLVVRSNKATHLANFQKEAWCLKEAGKLGIPVPCVIACVVQGERAYSIAAYLENTRPVESGVEELRVWETLGSYASKLNKIPEQGTVSEKEAPALFKENWAESVKQDLSFAFRDDYWVKQGLLSKSQNSNLRLFLEQSAEIQAPHGLCQIDIGCENALLDSAGQVYLLDLELTQIGPVPQYQLACVSKTWGYKSEIMDAFIGGYGLSESEILQITPDLKRLTVLGAMRAVGWAQVNCKERVEGYSQYAMGMMRELVWEEL